MMSGEFCDIIKQGYVRLRSRKLGVWQRRWVLFKQASSTGPKRMEKYIDERAALYGGLYKVILLDLVVSVTRMPHATRRCGVTINFQNGATRNFCCDSEMEADDWCKVLSLELAPERCGIQRGEPDILMGGLHKEHNERFHVYLLSTSKLSIAGECTLQVTDENIYLWDVYNVRLKLAMWPLHSLLQYGRDNTRFTFEAGRYCETGEGLFTVRTIHGEAIYQRVHQASLAIADALERVYSRIQNKYQHDQTHACDGSSLSICSSLCSNCDCSQDENGNPGTCTAMSRQQKTSSFHLPLASPSKKPYTVFAAQQNYGTHSASAKIEISPSTGTSITVQDSNANSLRYNKLELTERESLCNLSSCSCVPNRNQDIWLPRPSANTETEGHSYYHNTDDL